MRNLWSIIILIVFVNFTALPSLAVLFDWDFPTLNINAISEEEDAENCFANFNEKLPPKPYCFKDFFGTLYSNKNVNSFILRDDSIHLSPFISIFSPPPEV